MVFRKPASPNGRILIRQERPEAFWVDVEKDGCSSVQTWPAVGPAAVTLIELLRRYEEEFRRNGDGPGQWSEVEIPVTRSDPADVKNGL